MQVKPAAILVVLPGMDGTGALLADFAEALRGKIKVHLITYPNNRVMTYEELGEFVQEQLPSPQPFILLGESFGGPLALMVADKKPSGLVGVVLCASFAQYPISAVRFISPFVRLAPVFVPPAWVLRSVLLGQWHMPELLARLKSILVGLPAAVLRNRAAAALRVDARGATSRLGVPLLCLRALKDRVVPFASASAMASLAPNCRVVDLEAPHFLLQVAPKESAELVLSFAQGAAF
jgi:pimeloyl-ACP methyl ester carboxylesterase